MHLSINMKTRRKSIYLTVFYLFNTLLAFAQKPALLPADPAIRSNVFSNGLSCYVVDNKSEKGVADFLLIRRGHEGGEVLCRVEDKILRNEDVLDSTLLYLMRRVSADCIPADQALVVSGDVDAASVMSRLRYMSLMIDGSQPSPMPAYEWKGDGMVRHSCLSDSLKGISTVIMEWNAPRTPVEYTNTVQPAVYGKSVAEIGNVACRWIRRSLFRLDVPVADVSFDIKDSFDGYSDEKYELTVTVAEKDSSAAIGVAYSVLDAIDRGLTSDSDIRLAENIYMSDLGRKAGRPVWKNSDYTKICVDAFLYNAPLSTDRERFAFFRSKDVSYQIRRNVFSDIASALIDVGPVSDTLSDLPLNIMLNDTLSFPGPMEKIKMRSSKKDAFSGGSIWTFANGFRVIYKQMPTDHVLYYSMSLNGGYGNVAELDRGEGAYFSDYDDLCWISGMKASYFKAMLNLSGMTMDARVNMFNTVISGKVQNRNAALMMKALLAFANERRLDPEAETYYLASERLRQITHHGKDFRNVLDSLMCPGYRYSPYRSESGLYEDTMDKAESLYSSLSSKMNDGVLVVVGDMNPSDLMNLLRMYVGGFKVKDVASRRPSHNFSPVSGISTCYAEGGKDEMLMAISSRMPMTAENHMAVEIAAMLFERKLRELFSDKGLDADIAYSRSIYPDERFSFIIRLPGVSGTEELLMLRDAVSKCLEQEIDADVLSHCKEYVRHKYSQMTAVPEYWLKVIPLRHLEGKDYTSGYAAKIDAVSSEKIREVFDALETGAGVEYIMRKN